jgi:hypothetical protein
MAKVSRSINPSGFNGRVVKLFFLLTSWDMSKLRFHHICRGEKCCWQQLRLEGKDEGGIFDVMKTLLHALPCGRGRMAAGISLSKPLTRCM